MLKLILTSDLPLSYICTQLANMCTNEDNPCLASYGFKCPLFGKTVTNCDETTAEDWKKAFKHED